MSAHQRYLERLYDEAAGEAEADAWARERGYEDAEDYLEAIRDEAADRKFEEQRERRAFGEDW